ncbi:MAG TPA: outer membrane beta-barrel protein [Gammaproteobacteria bacterium]|nr:outer membrane beta-barrel protein [Gammaproteobacteria bacterium]
MQLARSATFAALVLAAFAALGADNTEGLYVGAGLGDFSVEINDVDDVPDAVSDFDEDESASKYFVGWRLSRFFSVQGEYYDLGNATGTLKGQPVSTETEGVGVSVVGTLPLAFIELFARAGFIFYDLDVNRGAGNVIDESDNDPVYSAGIGFTVFDRLNFQLEYEVIDIHQLDHSDALWLNASWRF